MTSWVVVIAGTHPQHWEIAKKHAFWDMTSMHKVALGDTVYFWQGGGSLLAQCTATSPASPIVEDDPLPWEDSGERHYVARFHFSCLSDSPSSQPRWGDLQQQWGKRYPLQLRFFTDRAAEQVLAAYFDSEPVGDPYDDDERERELERLGYDRRTFAMRAIAQRQGQPAFRNALLKAYGGRCAVTGTGAESVLEAAHIAAYKGTHSNYVYNGLLLRADIHTLLDLDRITVTPDYVVRVDPSLGSPYAELDGRDLLLPQHEKDRPEGQLLQEHNARCSWLT